MQLLLYRKRLAMGVCCLLLAGCSAGNEEAPASSSSQSEASQSQPASNAASSSNDEESQPVVRDVSDELVMDPALILLPTHFPNNQTTEIAMDIVTNEKDNYGVVYTYESGKQQIGVSGRIYASAEAAVQNIDETVNGSVAVPQNEESSYDLGYGITGYGEGAAGNSYFGWQEGNWTFTIHSLFQDNLDVHPIAETIVAYLEVHFLPAPSQKGTVYIDFAQEGDRPSIHILWNKDNRVYETNTIESPTDALDIILSME